MSTERRRASWLPRFSDPVSLAFGVGFSLLGVAGLLEAAGVNLSGANTVASPVLLCGLGAAGLWSVWRRDGRSRFE